MNNDALHSRLNYRAEYARIATSFRAKPLLETLMLRLYYLGRPWGGLRNIKHDSLA